MDSLQLAIDGAGELEKVQVVAQGPRQAMSQAGDKLGAA
jgi:hypothetical protein